MQSVNTKGVVRVGNRVVAFTPDAIDDVTAGGKAPSGVDLGCRNVREEGPRLSPHCGSQAYHRRKKR